jgi:hypothetical protein
VVALATWFLGDWRRWSGHAKSPVMLVEALQYEEDESNSVGREVRWPAFLLGPLIADGSEPRSGVLEKGVKWQASGILEDAAK